MEQLDRRAVTLWNISIVESPCGLSFSAIAILQICNALFPSSQYALPTLARKIGRLTGSKFYWLSNAHVIVISW